jgi:hypothetical protein
MLFREVPSDGLLQPSDATEALRSVASFVSAAVHEFWNCFQSIWFWSRTEETDVNGTYPVRVPAGLPAALTHIFDSFSQSLQVKAGTVS